MAMRTKWMYAVALQLALAGMALQSIAQQPSQAVLAALAADPPADAQHPARLVELTVPSQGSAMNAVFYLASGAGPHPVVLLLHGFPGNEQNLDLAQAMRRAGWSVLTFHYRGSWGSPGAFSFSHAIEDTDAALAFLRDPAVDAKYALDPKRIVVIGHSMGGFLALHAASTHPWLAGVAVMSAANFGGMAAEAKTPAAQQQMIGFFRSELPPLAGCTAESLWADVTSHAAQWNFVDWAPAIRPMPALVLDAADGLAEANVAMAEALRKAGDPHVSEQHMATDHSFSDHRIAAETAMLTWLGTLPIPK
jgi:pimeloyl-ACP methyl ester carboxylesterase